MSFEGESGMRMEEFYNRDIEEFYPFDIKDDEVNIWSNGRRDTKREEQRGYNIQVF